MSRKVFSGVLAGIGMLALSTTAAQAGSGGGVPTALTSFFICKTINGDSAGRSVDVQAFNTDPANPAGWGNTLRGVPLGNATLACAFAKLFLPAAPDQPVGSTTEIHPQASSTSGFKDLKCYSISVSKGQIQPGAPPSYTVSDNLFPNGVDTGVTGSSMTYICAPAHFSAPQ